jgi:hypothetical protein
MGIDVRSGRYTRGRLRRASMKAKPRLVLAEDNHMSRNEQVRREIQVFLQAVDSYPDRFAREPEVTFEQHRSGLVMNGGNRRRRLLSRKAS